MITLRAAHHIRSGYLGCSNNGADGQPGGLGQAAGGSAAGHDSTIVDLGRAAVKSGQSGRVLRGRLRASGVTVAQRGRSLAGLAGNGRAVVALAGASAVELDRALAGRVGA